MNLSKRLINLNINSAIFFQVAVFYLEIVLRLFTCERFFTWGLIPVAVFSACTGLLLEAIVIRLSKKAAKGTAVGVFIGLFVLFSTQAVYHGFFNKYLIIYSIGAGGADQILGEGILQNTLNALFSGLPAMVLFALPFVFLLIFFDRFTIKRKPVKASLIISGVALACHIATITAISFIPSMSATQSGIFDPNHAVSRFGLLRTEVLDIKYNMLGIEQNIELESEDVKDEEPPKEVVYEPNVMDIDFSSLAENETDQTLKTINEYFASKEPTYKNEYTGMYEGYNLVYLVAEGFSPYAIDPVLTPTLYKMQQDGFNFTNFYTPIWGVSTSDGEYTACTGLIPKSGVWSFYRSSENYMPFTLGNMFRSIGVENTYAYHNNTHTYYHRDKSHPNMGYDYKGMGTGVEKYVKNVWPQSDLEMISGSVSDYLSSGEPFHAYYMTISGHLEYTVNGNSMATKNWELVKDLDCSDELKAYYACNIELDRAMEKLLAELNTAGVADKTVIAITPDHYPYGLEQDDTDKYAKWRELLGRDVETTFELYKSCFLLYCQATTDAPTVDKYCSSLDILPTLLNLFGFEYDSRLLMGSDILSTAEELVIFSDRSFISGRGMYDADTQKFTAFEGRGFDTAEEEQNYIVNMKAVVSNKFKISAKMLEEDYYGYVFNK